MLCYYLVSVGTNIIFTGGILDKTKIRKKILQYISITTDPGLNLLIAEPNLKAIKSSRQ